MASKKYEREVSRVITNFLFESSLDGSLPGAINSPDVDWILTYNKGTYGITHQMAFNLNIRLNKKFVDHCGNYVFYNGSLRCVNKKYKDTRFPGIEFLKMERQVIL